MAQPSPIVSGLPSPRKGRSRAQSISSDRPSTVSHTLGLASPPLAVSPGPEFIASLAAAQIVTHDHDHHAAAWYDQNGIEPPCDPAVVTPDALRLVNAFLDQLLFNFLQVSRSTSLSALRPAVSEILKPKLAKDVIANADDELREYLGIGDEDDYSPPPNPRASRDWDVELAWKRTRLRCMVYSSLGNMEDEDLYMEQENLEIGAHERISHVISPAAAIWLTSVLEYMGELTLTVAGQAAYNRVRAKIEKDLKDGTRRRTSNVADNIVVDDMDMERVALDRTLGRLWRGWKKRARHTGGELGVEAASTDLTAPPRRDHAIGGFSARSSESELVRLHGQPARPKKASDEPSHIPLPLSDKDVDEIEIPGLVHYSDDELDDTVVDEANAAPRRHRSLIITPPAGSRRVPALTLFPPQRPMMSSRKRANSLPTPGASPFYAPDKHMDLGRSTHEPRGAQRGTKPPVLGAGEAPHPGHIPSSSTTSASSRALPASSGDKHPQAASGAALTVTSAAATRGAPADALRRGSALSERDDEDDVVTYETAEIITSSRVSIAGSLASVSLPSESGRASTVKRSSSVRSARIVDVPAPRSPAHSRHTSVDTAERARRISPYGLVNHRVAAVENDGRIRAFEREAELSGHGSTSHASMERKRHSRPQTVSIFESDEDHRLRSSDSAPPRIAGLAKAASITSAAESVPCRVKMEQATSNSTGKISLHARREYAISNVKASTPTILNVSTGPFREDNVPGAPPKASGHSGRHSPKTDGRGMTPIERSRAKDTDEELALPMQSNVTPRQTHTSASSASSGTSRARPVRASEDNSSRADNVARKLEELIHSNQTITYTLTPENMRDIDSKRSIDSPVVTKFPRKSEETRGQQTPRSSPTAAEAPRSPFSHHPVSPISPRAGEGKATKSPGPIPRVPGGLAASASRPGGPEARDARTYGESTADFAQFIKCTGPASDKAPPRLQVKTSTTPVKSSMEIYPVSLAISRERYQPRDAAVDNRGDSSDLIDFIRQGPPTAASSHRIPRHVAPFRSTMDSDQLNGAVGGMAVDATIPEIRYSQGSTNMTEHSMPSMQSSINSNSALLKKGAPGLNAGFDDDTPMPKRKQRRVRDPYAIDLSDEDDADEGFAETPRPPARKEESLAEFLRNYEPPPEPPSEPPRMPRKKYSAPSLIGRLTRNGNRDGRDHNSSSSPGTNTSTKQDALSPRSRAAAGGGYIPIQVNMPPGYDMHGLADNNQSSRLHKTSAASSAGRVPMKKFEPREAIMNRSQTSDLAAFLRDSAPPDTSSRGPPRRASASWNPSRQDDGNGLAKFFGRKKKAGAT